MLLLYGVRDSSLEGSDPLREIVELFVRRDDAERLLAECLADEPGWAGVLSVEAVELDATSGF